MDSFDVLKFTINWLIVLGAGLLSGLICRQAGVSFLVGYLIVGSLIGEGGLGLVHPQGELDVLAQAGALLLLFAVGIEFSFEELRKLSRHFFVGGSLQMLLVAVPVTLLCHWVGWTWSGAILAGVAVSLSSTVLVFRSLNELGQVTSPFGRGALGILLFQDVALVPMLLLIPLLTGNGQPPTVMTFVVLAAKSVLFVAGGAIMRWLLRNHLVPLVWRMRSVELVVLGTLCFLGGTCFVATSLGLPAAIGALAAGIAISGNRLSHQIDSILLPFRETFAAIFFVTLGAHLPPASFFAEPVLLSIGLVLVILLKAGAAAVALRCVGLPWKPALGMGLGLSQLGEFSFLLISAGVSQHLVSATDHHRLLVIAMGSLILTPLLLRVGLDYAGEPDDDDVTHADDLAHLGSQGLRGLVIGIGPIGRQVAARLERLGVTPTLVDLSPINLQPFAQHGLVTTPGDARDPAVLKRAGAADCAVAVVCVPVDEIAVQVVRSLRELQPDLPIIVRCRFEERIAELSAAGAQHVVSEEAEASGPLLKFCEQLLLANV